MAYRSFPKPATADDYDEYEDDGGYAYSPITNLTVFDSPPRDTGLLDAKGNRIMWVPDPIGFGLE